MRNHLSRQIVCSFYDLHVIFWLISIMNSGFNFHCKFVSLRPDLVHPQRTDKRMGVSFLNTWQRNSAHKPRRRKLRTCVSFDQYITIWSCAPPGARSPKSALSTYAPTDSSTKSPFNLALLELFPSKVELSKNRPSMRLTCCTNSLYCHRLSCTPSWNGSISTRLVPSLSFRSIFYHASAASVWIWMPKPFHWWLTNITNAPAGKSSNFATFLACAILMTRDEILLLSEDEPKRSCRPEIHRASYFTSVAVESLR